MHFFIEKHTHTNTQIFRSTSVVVFVYINYYFMSCNHFKLYPLQMRHFDANTCGNIFSVLITIILAISKYFKGNNFFYFRFSFRSQLVFLFFFIRATKKYDAKKCNSKRFCNKFICCDILFAKALLLFSHSFFASFSCCPFSPL